MKQCDGKYLNLGLDFNKKLPATAQLYCQNLHVWFLITHVPWLNMTHVKTQYVVLMQTSFSTKTIIPKFIHMFKISSSQRMKLNSFEGSNWLFWYLTFHFFPYNKIFSSCPNNTHVSVLFTQAFHTQWFVQLPNCKWKFWSGKTKICGLCVIYTW